MIIADLTAAPGGHYRVILADSPWAWKPYSPSGLGRSPQAHIETMSLEEIKALPVPGLAAANCALVLWAYTPKLDEAFEVMRAWGFKYCSTTFIWAKCAKSDPTRFPIGSGLTTRKQAEICLLGKKGNPVRIEKGVGELIVAPRRLPMQKPDEQYKRIERLYRGPYIELFSRKTRPGWDCWGNEAGLFDNGPVRTRRIPSGRTPQVVRVGPGR